MFPHIVVREALLALLTFHWVGQKHDVAALPLTCRYVMVSRWDCERWRGPNDGVKLPLRASSSLAASIVVRRCARSTQGYRWEEVETMSKSMDEFKGSKSLVELGDLDDLWYFVKSTSGNWIAGSGH